MNRDPSEPAVREEVSIWLRDLPSSFIWAFIFVALMTVGALVAASMAGNLAYLTLRPRRTLETQLSEGSLVIAAAILGALLGAAFTAALRAIARRWQQAEARRPFSLRFLLALVAVCAVLFGWCSDHLRLQRQIYDLQRSTLDELDEARRQAELQIRQAELEVWKARAAPPLSNPSRLPSE